MLMSVLWTVVIVASVLYGAAVGASSDVGNAAMEGAAQAVSFVITTGGAVCLWCGVMEVMAESGISAALSRALRPVLKRLFPNAAAHPDIMDALSANVSANLLGLGNAATPMGVKAAQGMARLSGSTASDELCLLVVINTASIQLIPTTTAALRAAFGASSPFDILPAVWVSSAVSVLCGLTAAFALSSIRR